MTSLAAPLFALILATQAVSPVLVAPPDDVARAGVDLTLDRLHEAASLANGSNYFALFTPDARFIGTDATEHWTLAEFRAYAEPFFARGQGWTYVPHDRVVTLAPIDCRCIAWFEEQLTHASYGETRGSGVLRLTNDGWKIEQYVLSFSIPNDKADAVVAAVKGETPQGD